LGIPEGYQPSPKEAETFAAALNLLFPSSPGVRGTFSMRCQRSGDVHGEDKQVPGSLDVVGNRPTISAGRRSRRHSCCSPIGKNPISRAPALIQWPRTPLAPQPNPGPAPSKCLYASPTGLSRDTPHTAQAGVQRPHRTG
jgi:hypothetical protein